MSVFHSRQASTFKLGASSRFQKVGILLRHGTSRRVVHFAKSLLNNYRPSHRSRREGLDEPLFPSWAVKRREAIAATKIFWSSITRDTSRRKANLSQKKL